VVVCIGELNYAEKPGDIDDLSLNAGQLQYVMELSSTNVPVVLVIISGRPRLLNGAVQASTAVLMAYQPGPMGGTAIVEVLLGKFSPSGRLPFTYPKHSGTFVVLYRCVIHTRNQYCTHAQIPLPLTLQFDLSPFNDRR
jgi:beta-glucosidase